MKFKVLLLGLALALPLHAAMPPGSRPARIVVTEFDQSGERYQLRVAVTGGTSLSQLVVLVRYVGTPGYRPAADAAGKPVLPQEDVLGLRRSQMQQQSIKSSRASEGTNIPLGESAWRVDFQRPKVAKPIAEVYAVVCNVRERTGWNKARDYRGFQYLPFEKTQTIDDALNVLRDFGWTPIGLARVELTKLDRGAIRKVPVK